MNEVDATMSSDKIIHVGEFHSVSEIKIASELYYVCELGKYLSVCGYALSLDGVVLNNVLRKSRYWDYFRIAIKNGWVVNVTCAESEIAITEQNPVDLETVENRLFSETPVKESKAVEEKRVKDELFNLSTPVSYQIQFRDKSSGVWVWDKGINPDVELLHSKAFGTQYISQCFVSLIAYCAVNRFLTHECNELKLVLDLTHLTLEHSISDVLLLLERTDAIGWVDLKLNVNEKRQLNLGYEAWLYLGRESGFEQREYSNKEKLSNLKRLGFEVGDVIGLYKRKVTQKGNMVKSIVDFNFAVIRNVSSKGIVLDVINTNKTRFGAQEEFDKLATSVKAMFHGKRDFQHIKMTSRTYEWYGIGVEYMMDGEEFFIASLQGDDDCKLYVQSKDDPEKGVFVNLNEYDYIYWLLRDYNVEFNEDRFLRRYFKNSLPAYTQYYGEIV